MRTDVNSNLLWECTNFPVFCQVLTLKTLKNLWGEGERWEREEIRWEREEERWETDEITSTSD